MKLEKEIKDIPSKYADTLAPIVRMLATMQMATGFEGIIPTKILVRMYSRAFDKMSPEAKRAEVNEAFSFYALSYTAGKTVA